MSGLPRRGPGDPEAAAGLHQRSGGGGAAVAYASRSDDTAAVIQPPQQQPPANPFEAPASQSPYEQGDTVRTFDIGVALSDGWQACWRSFGAWIVAGLVVTIAAIFATATVIGVFVVLPVLWWGFVHFTLRALDGNAELGHAFAGFSRFGEALAAMLGLSLLMIPLSLIGQIPVWVSPLFGDSAGPVVMLIGQAFNLAWSLAIMIRFQLAPFFIVDQRMGVIDSMRASWRSTSQSKLMLVLFYIVTFLVAVLGLMALVVGVIPAVIIAMGATASVYRQLTGTRALSESAL